MLSRSGIMLCRQLYSLLRRKPVLSSIVIQPTFRCNLRCTYCSMPYRAGEELDMESWHSILLQARKLGCQRVAIHGGEPLVRPDIAKLIKLVKENGMKCVLTSNGLLVPKFIDALGLLDTLVLSLDAAGEANDTVRGEGVFTKVCSAIYAARDAGIPTKINAVLSTETISELDHLLAFAESRGLHITINIVRSGNDQLWHNASRIKPDNASLRAVLERLSTLAKQNSRLLFSSHSYDFSAKWPDFSIDRIEEKEINPAWRSVADVAPACHAGRSYLVIAPNGDASPCSLTDGQLGHTNVLRDGLMQAWQSFSSHKCIACFSPCLVEQNYLLSLNPAVMINYAKRHLPHFA